MRLVAAGDRAPGDIVRAEGLGGHGGALQGKGPCASLGLAETRMGRPVRVVPAEGSPGLAGPATVLS